MTKTLHLVDASGYLFRSYYALPPMRRSDGVAVQGVYGFVGMLMRLVMRKDIDLLGIVFDTSRKSFRQDLYPEYKAHRPPPPPDLIPQFALIREATEAFGLKILAEDGFEADDLIATYAEIGKAEGYQVVIDSSDKDMMQLVCDEVTMHDPLKNKRIGREQVKETFGVYPEKMVSLQALAGDSSDNIPGVPGIGAKTAAMLLETYGSLEGILSNVEDISQKKRRENLKEYQEDARLSYQLSLLRRDVPVQKSLATLERADVNADTLMAFLQQQEFQGYIRKWKQQDLKKAESPVLPNSRIPATAEPSDDPKEADYASIATTDHHYETILTEQALVNWMKKAKATGKIAIDTETTSLDVMEATLVGIALAVGPGDACYIPLCHLGEDVQSPDSKECHQELFPPALSPHESAPSSPHRQLTHRQLTWTQVKDILSPVLADQTILKVGQNLKYDLHILAKMGLDNITPIADTMLMSFVLDAGKEAHGGHSLDFLAKRHLHYQTIAFEEVAGKGAKKITFDLVLLPQATDYAAEDADITLQLYELLKPRLDVSAQNYLYVQIENKLIQVLKRMETAGIRIDKDAMATLGAAFLQKEQALEEQMFKIAGQTFSPGSPKQVREILFQVMGLSPSGKTKKGVETTRVDVLEELAREGHDIAKHLLAWRSFNKLRTTYTEGLLTSMKTGGNSERDRVHTTYVMTGARTGRLSSQAPNLQNIPVRTQEGRNIRKTFIAKEGCQLLALDYNQIELRLFADFSGESSMLQAFSRGEDIHALTASRVFQVALDAVDANMRRQAKAINFGIIYGMSSFGLAQQLSITNTQAKGFITAYFEEFPELKRYQETLLEQARTSGFVATPFGRRLYLGDIHHRNAAVRKHAERQAINAPIQGSAADMIKRAMIAIDHALCQKKLAAQMVLQVHDEIVLEVPSAQTEETALLVAGLMENASKPIYNMKVPLKVDYAVGQNWDEAH